MKNMLWFLLFFFTSITLLAYMHRKQYTYCNNGQMTALDKSIKMNGYYVTKVGNMLEPNFFYKDGSFANCITFIDSQNIEKLFNVDKRHKYYISGRVWVRWGRYVLAGDTIKTQSFYTWAIAASRVTEIWFLIKNDSTLEEIKNRSYEKNNIFSDHLPTNSDKFSHFVAHSNKPDSVSWLNKKSWYYCK